MAASSPSSDGATRLRGWTSHAALGFGLIQAESPIATISSSVAGPFPVPVVWIAASGPDTSPTAFAVTVSRRPFVVVLARIDSST